MLASTFTVLLATIGLGSATTSDLTMSPHAAQPHALIYRGPDACDGCPEAVGQLLMNSPSNFTVTYVGPHEKTKLSKAVLDAADVYAYPGGPDLDTSARSMKPYRQMMRDFVANGGRYLGFCLGAFLAGDPGFGFLEQQDNSSVTEEIYQPNAQVTNLDDSIIQVNWKFQTGPQKGTTANGKWLFFQDGAAMLFSGGSKYDQYVVARYTKNGDVAASITPFGKGWVGLTGPHPEADATWYTPDNPTNPSGITPKYGYDLVEATMAKSGGVSSAASEDCAGEECNAIFSTLETLEQLVNTFRNH